MKKYSSLILLLFFPAVLALAQTCPPDYGFIDGTGVCMPLNTGLPNPAGGVRGVISNFLMWLLGIFGFLGIIAFAISGFLYLTSAGNDDRIKTAKRAMNMALIGIVVGLSGMVAVYAIDRMLRGTNPFF